MGLEFSSEVWTIFIIAAGFCGWIVGSLYGAGRGSYDAVAGEDFDLAFAPTLTAKPVPQTSSSKPPLAPAAGKVSFPYANTPAGLKGRKEADLRRPKDAAAQAFCVDKIRSEARLILHSSDVWHTGKVDLQPIGSAQPSEQNSAKQDPTRLLNQYLGSIEELKRTNERRLQARSNFAQADTTPSTNHVPHPMRDRKIEGGEHQQRRLL